MPLECNIPYVQQLVKNNSNDTLKIRNTEPLWPRDSPDASEISNDQMTLICVVKLLYNNIYTNNLKCIHSSPLLWSCFVLHLTHWGRVTHICVSDLTIIGSDNGLSPGRRQAIIWTNAELLLNGSLGTNFHEILIEILENVFENVVCEMASILSRPQCVKSNVPGYISTPRPHLVLTLWLWPLILCPRVANRNEKRYRMGTLVPKDRYLRQW